MTGYAAVLIGGRAWLKVVVALELNQVLPLMHGVLHART